MSELAEARQSILQRDRLIARIAHELRDPVATLLLWETILRGARDEGLREQALDAIRRSAQVQESLVSSMLDLGRLLGGTLELDRQLIAIGDVVADAVARLESHATARHVHAERETGAELEMVFADPARLRQILLPMMSMVVDAAERGGRIVVSVRRKNSSILIAVSMGDPATAFAQTPDDEAPHGIEIALARELAIAHGGTLFTNHAGEPASALFTLPVAT